MTQMGTETPLRFSPGEFIINAHEPHGIGPLSHDLLPDCSHRIQG